MWKLILLNPKMGAWARVDDGAGVGFSVLSKDCERCTEKFLSPNLRVQKRFGLELQHLSKEDLGRTRLECRALSAKMGAEESGCKEAGTDEKLDPIEVSQATVVDGAAQLGNVSRSEGEGKAQLSENFSSVPVCAKTFFFFF